MPLLPAVELCLQVLNCDGPFFPAWSRTGGPVPTVRAYPFTLCLLSISRIRGKIRPKLMPNRNAEA
ncbi:MAG: hypothetical protein COS95_04375 [Ignavibacteriales bacterium CG07_land_8_20_14_0_80_59_12]|nr:MAG: hypothetical protein COS95_04375 [Ignavibacteriales bacterium CG07_land_8_20_14_0_80_59_12]